MVQVRTGEAPRRHRALAAPQLARRAKPTTQPRRAAALVRSALFSQGALRFERNGMVIDRVDVLASSVADSALAELANTVTAQVGDSKPGPAGHPAERRHQDGVDADQRKPRARRRAAQGRDQAHGDLPRLSPRAPAGARGRRRAAEARARP